jgi:chromosome partitioning protein
MSAAKAEARDLKNLLREAKQAGCDLAVIDSAPHSNAEAALACQVADFILIPCRPARFDLEAFETTIQIVKASRKPFAVVINAAPRGRIAQEAQELLKTTYNVNVLPTILHHRAAYSHAVIDGRAVSEFEPDGKAAHEITALHRDITALWSDTRR